MPDSNDRVSVQTYVSSTQRDLWRQDAEELDMSQAEYVRTMVQAGRRAFSLRTQNGSASSTQDNREETTMRTVTPGVDGLEEQVLEIIRENECADWETLLAGITDDVEDRLDSTLDTLQSTDRIRYSGRRGGYTRVEDAN